MLADSTPGRGPAQGGLDAAKPRRGSPAGGSASGACEPEESLGHGLGLVEVFRLPAVVGGQPEADIVTVATRSRITGIGVLLPPAPPVVVVDVDHTWVAYASARERW